MTDEDKKKIEEGRKLLEALEVPVAGKTPMEILTIMAGVGLAHLRMAKAEMDATKAVQEMAKRINAGPRPTPGEAGLS